jgi:hypothetical protein
MPWLNACTLAVRGVLDVRGMLEVRFAECRL